MADIIPLGERLRKKKEGILSKEKKQRLEAFRMVMQCTACPHKCAKCGSQLEVPQPRLISENLPLRLCPGCMGEFQLYQALTLGRSPVEGRDYYHNPTWVEVWKSWLEYQKCLQQYRTSEEFLQLVEELTEE